MNYQLIYANIVDRARTRQLVGYSETHHVIPRCMGGTDDAENLVELTPEEHFLCHQLLARIHRHTEHYHKLIFAVHSMTRMSPARQGCSKLKLFGWIRREMAQAISSANKGKPKSQAMRDKLSTRVISAETKAKIAASLRKHNRENPQKRSEEQKAKISNTLKGRKLPEDHIANIKKGLANRFKNN